MELFDFNDVKAEKANAMRRFNRLRGITIAFRALELALALVLLSWIFNRLPLAIMISRDVGRWLAGVVASPLFVFALSNGIIVALIAKSGERHDNAETELYEDIVKNSGAGDRKDTDVKTTSQSLEESVSRPCLYTLEEKEDVEVVYQDKQIINEVNTCHTTATTISRTRENSGNDGAKSSNPGSDSDTETENKPPAYRRSKSEKLAVKRREKVLRRSETAKCGSDFAAAREAEAKEESLLYPQDKLSSEEFQRTVEEFIAKELKFRRKESKAIVVQAQS